MSWKAKKETPGDRRDGRKTYPRVVHDSETWTRTTAFAKIGKYWKEKGNGMMWWKIRIYVSEVIGLQEKQDREYSEIS